MVYPIKLNTLGKFGHMKSIILIVFFVFLLFPISSSFSQKTDETPALAIQFTSTSPFHFKDENGYTIILGEIQNIKSSYITNVEIRGYFYDDFSEQPLDSSIGSSIIEVIPPFAKVPYMITSTKPNAGITQVSVQISGLNTTPAKNEELKIESEILEIGEEIKISGTLTNQGSLNTNQTKIHLVLHDSFEPTTIRGFSTIMLEGTLKSGASVDFEFHEKLDVFSRGYKILAESENYNSNVQTNKITIPEALTKLVTINDISIKDDEGNKLSDVKAGNRINFESKIWIQYSEDQETTEQPYRYYVQVKQTGEKAFVEFIGIYEGSFISAGAKFPEVKWTPNNTGLYFVETFVWDTNAVPLASKGPIILILVT